MESLVPASFNNEPQNSKANNITHKESVALDKLLQKALIQAQAFIEAHHIIVRCDELPVVEGNGARLEELLQAIIGFVVSARPQSSKQFLYVQCKEGQCQNDVLGFDNAREYQIDFHSNIILDSYWPVVHRDKIQKCEQIARENNGRFTINNLNSGCSFTLQLTGKSL